MHTKSTRQDARLLNASCTWLSTPFLCKATLSASIASWMPGMSKGFLMSAAWVYRNGREVMTSVSPVATNVLGSMGTRLGRDNLIISLHVISDFSHVTSTRSSKGCDLYNL